MLPAQEGLCGLAGSRDRAGLCLPRSSAALTGFGGLCQARGLGCLAMAARVGMPWRNVCSMLCSHMWESCLPRVLGSDFPQSWSASGPRADTQHSPAALPVIPALPRLLPPCVQQEAVTGWHPTPSKGDTQSLGQGQKQMEGSWSPFLRTLLSGHNFTFTSFHGNMSALQ